MKCKTCHAAAATLGQLCRKCDEAAERQARIDSGCDKVCLSGQRDVMLEDAAATLAELRDAGKARCWIWKGDALYLVKCEQCHVKKVSSITSAAV